VNVVVNIVAVWFGVLFIRQGFYQGGIFRFTINIPSTFPDSDCPVSLKLSVELSLSEIKTFQG
jgi:ubiquitin-protein ligase